MKFLVKFLETITYRVLYLYSLGEALSCLTCIDRAQIISGYVAIVGPSTSPFQRKFDELEKQSPALVHLLVVQNSGIASGGPWYVHTSNGTMGNKFHDSKCHRIKVNSVSRKSGATSCKYTAWVIRGATSRTVLFLLISYTDNKPTSPNILYYQS